MLLSRLGLWAGTAAVTIPFVGVLVAFVLAEYVLFVGLVFVVLSVLLSYLVDGTVLLATSAVVATVPICYQLYRLLSAELTGDPAVVRLFRDTVAGFDREPGTDLSTRVDDLATRAGVPTPTVIVLETATPITAAVGYRRSTATLFLSRGVLETVDGRELEAVIAHELAHLRNRDAMVMTALAATWANARIHHDRESAFSLFTSLPGIAGSVCSAGVARCREYAADDRAVAITGDRETLANALEAVEATLEERSVGPLRTNPALGAFSIVPPPEYTRRRRFDPIWYDLTEWLLRSHPPTERRLERLRSLLGRPARISDSESGDREDEQSGLPAKRSPEYVNERKDDADDTQSGDRQLPVRKSPDHQGGGGDDIQPRERHEELPTPLERDR